MCGAPDYSLLGVLNVLTWVRCRACGMDYCIETKEEE